MDVAFSHGQWATWANVFCKQASGQTGAPAACSSARPISHAQVGPSSTFSRAIGGPQAGQTSQTWADIQEFGEIREQQHVDVSRLVPGSQRLLFHVTLSQAVSLWRSGCQASDRRRTVQDAPLVLITQELIWTKRIP